MRTGLMMLSLILWTGAAYPVAVPTEVDSVVVYTSGASVTRRGQIDLAAGTHELAIEDLPAGVGIDRLQLSLGEGAELGQVRVEGVQRSEAFDREVQALVDRIDAVQMQIRTLDDSSRTAELKLKFLDGIAQGYAKESWFEGARGNADVSGWRGALGVLEEGSNAARKTLRDNDAARKDAQQALSQLERELQTMQGQRLASVTVRAAVTVARTSKVPVRLSYHQNQARWWPRYEARLDSATGSLRIAQKAQVQQGTDEAWRNVALTLATAQPTGELVPPELGPRFLDLEDPKERRQFSRDANRMEEVMVTAAKAGAPAPAPPRTAVQVSGYGVLYELPGRVEVPNDFADEQSFDLSEFEVKADLLTRIFPSQTPTPFLSARFVYAGDEPQYASAVNVYLDGTFVGETELPTLLPGDEITLPVGQDRRVELNVRDQGGEKGEGGLISRRKQVLTTSLFEITNRRQGQSTVEVIDRIPVSRHQDIEVEVPRAATSPAQTNLDDQEGVLLWRKTLGPGEVWRIQHQYQISYPAAMRLVE